MDEFTFRSSNKHNMIHGVIWKPEGEIRAILQISHGMIEYIERYADFAEYLNKYGILVIGNDHLGHGKSVLTEEEWGYFADKNGGTFLVRDLLTVTKLIKSELPGIPVFLLGHSMGSFMARRYLINFGDYIDGAIIMGTGNPSSVSLSAGRMMTATLAKLHGGHYRSDAVNKMAFGSYNKRIANPQSPNAWLTRDEEIVKKYDSTPENTFKFTVSGFNQIFETIQYIENPKLIDKIPKNIPILLISGEEDPVGGYGKEVQKVYEALDKAGIDDLTIELVEGARHEVLNEINKEETYKYILDWIEAHI